MKAVNRPKTIMGKTNEIYFKARYFSTQAEAQRVMSILQNTSITTERVRMSATQGEVRVFINGKFIVSFGDKMVLPESGAAPDDYYGDDVDGWRSSEADSVFVLALIWHSLDHVYRYSDLVCSKLGIKAKDWIGGK